MRGKKVPDSVVAEIAKKLAEGVTRAQIMADYHLGYDRVANIAKDYGIATTRMDDDFKCWFREQWSNIYPGDAARKRRVSHG